MNAHHLLVSTKFAPPRLGTRHIVRQHLLNRLRDAQRLTVVLVTGSAGFGKTVLLAQWRLELMKAGATVAWLSLSHDDRRLPGFSAYLLAAFRKLGLPEGGEVSLDSDSSPLMDTLVAQLINWAAGVPAELTLVLDDYHHVEDPGAHRLVEKLLEHAPANLHFIIASRATPPLGVTRLRLLGQVAEIDCEALPFDLNETRQFFEINAAAQKLSADELRLIHDLTSGWPATQQLLASTLSGQPATRQRLRELGRRAENLQAYLAEDVAAHLPAELNEFLEALSVCRRFNVELAAAVAHSDSAAEMIRRAEEENLLIYRIESDDVSPWYRYHPLFGEFLAARLARRGETAVKQCHRRAGRWFAEHGFLTEAVHHAVRAGELEAAVEAIEHAAPETWSLAYTGPLVNLLERLPPETLLTRPQLSFLACLTFAATARHAKAETWLAQMRDTALARDPAIAGKLALVDATVALQRDDAARAVALLEPLQSSALGPSRMLHYMWLASLALAYAACGRHAQAYRLLVDHPVPAEDQKFDVALIVEGGRAATLIVEGRVKEAARQGAPVLARCEAALGRHSISANLIAATLGDAYYELDMIDKAREVLANRPSNLLASTPGTMLMSMLCHARLDQLQVSPEAALDFLETHAAHYQGLRLDRLVAYALAEQIHILLARGDLFHLQDHVTRLDELAAAYPDERQEEQGCLAEIPAIAALARARLALAERDSARALQWLHKAREPMQRLGRLRSLVRVDLLSTLALDGLGRAADAKAALLRALASGARLGLVRTFVDEGQGIAAQLGALQGDAALDEALAAYLQTLLARFAAAGLGVAVAAPTAAALPPAIGTLAMTKPAAAADGAKLTPRELEILGLISRAMSNKRIALTLGITLETVKWNVKNILAKLGVSSRYDAMTWARKRDLID